MGRGRRSVRRGRLLRRKTSAARLAERAGAKSRKEPFSTDGLSVSCCSLRTGSRRSAPMTERVFHALRGDHHGLSIQMEGRLAIGSCFLETGDNRVRNGGDGQRRGRGLFGLEAKKSVFRRRRASSVEMEMRLLKSEFALSSPGFMSRNHWRAGRNAAVRGAGVRCAGWVHDPARDANAAGDANSCCPSGCVPRRLPRRLLWTQGCWPSLSKAALRKGVLRTQRRTPGPFLAAC